MKISAKVDYGLRALLTLASSGKSMTIDAIAEAQQLPNKYLGAILNDLRRAGIVLSKRGADPGYRLARPAREISVADVFSALEGQFARMNGMQPEAAHYDGAASHLQDVWLAMRASLEQFLASMTLEDVVRGRIPRGQGRTLVLGSRAPDREGLHIESTALNKTATQTTGRRMPL